MKTKSLLFSLLMLVSFSAFAQEPAQNVKKYNIKEIGKETIMDKECTKYTMENEVQGIKAMVTSWIYKGLAVKTVSEVQGIKIEATVTEFQEDVMVLPQMFDIPKF